MKISGNVLTSIDEKDIKFGVLTIPEGVSEIAPDFLRHVKEKPRKIIFPSSLRSIGEGLLKDNQTLREVVFNGGIEKIEKEAFACCENLKEVKLPDTINLIDESSFSGCVNLKKVVFPKSKYRIGQNAFFGCEKLSGEIDLGNVEYIDDSAFEGCINLKKVNIKSIEMESIEERAFYGCCNLEYISLPQKIKTIKSGAFAGCESLKSIVLPEGIEKIAANTFSCCYSLRSVKMPDSVKLIASNAFSKCEKLKFINMPQDLLSIYAFAFSDCKSLEDVKFPSKLRVISNNAFSGCANLKDVEFNENLQSIGTSAFEKCYLLKEVILNELDVGERAFEKCFGLNKFSINNGTLYGSSLSSCPNLKSLSLGKKVELINFDISSLQKLEYITKNEDMFSITSSIKEGQDSVGLTEVNGINIDILLKCWENRNKICAELKNENVARLYNVLFAELGEEKFKEFWENKNLTFFKQLSNLPRYEEDFNAFCRFYYNLGGFLKPINETRITKSKNEVTTSVDYAQMVGEFFKDKLTDENNVYQNSFAMFDGMKLGSFKPEFTRFFLNKDVYAGLLEETKREIKIFKKCYEEFERVQETNTSNKGNQRQLKPTVKKFVDTFINNNFSGVTDENYDIASVLTPYFTSQRTFEKALAIREEKERLGTGNNILEEHLEEQDVFGNLDALGRMIKSKGVSTLKIMSDIAKDNFTFEWLEKNDPRSYILGKLCHCCAFIEGKGFTYMKASIVNPDIQNLVIKDKTGAIIAKSTLYVNREQGYGIFNNLEINRNVHIDNLNEVFRKFQLGAVAFVEKYNKQHPDKPLTKVNIGMDCNKAKEQIESEFEKEKHLLPSFKYTDYADGDNNGDAASLKIQYTVWKEKDE